MSDHSETLKLGDTITHFPFPDNRTWWQRHAPRWLGGKPSPYNGPLMVTAIAKDPTWSAEHSDFTTE